MKESLLNSQQVGRILRESEDEVKIHILNVKDIDIYADRFPMDRALGFLIQENELVDLQRVEELKNVQI